MRVLPLALAAAIFSGATAILIYISGLSSYGGAGLSEADLAALAALQGGFSKCVDYCRVVIQYPSDTDSKWKDPIAGESEGLAFEFNICEAVASWEQVCKSTTILTKEYIDALPNGWEEYAWRRINKGILLNKCRKITLFMEKLSLVLPDTSPYVPQQFGRCAVVDAYISCSCFLTWTCSNFFFLHCRTTRNMLVKSTFRLLNRGSAKALDKVVELDGKNKKEALIVKTTIHDIMNQMILYLMLGTSFGSSAKGTGLKALEFALPSVIVYMYGFTVDPGYKEWTRYFSESRKGHTPLHGRAYYQMMECLARVASEKLLKRPGAGSDDPLGTCTMIKKRKKRKAPNRSGLRDAATNHLRYMKGATRYPLERSAGGGYLCMINDR
ncbi:hypothetical protein ZWY2020_040828 [Hordeum vulgare]|nr:hypothetical protein ZWY2020_040828 [Hordeum vulgare]